MQRIDLINQIIARKEKIGITVENLARLSGVGVRTINRLLKNEDVMLSTIEHVTNFLGLDFAGNEQVSLSILKKQRAHQKALFLASIVQGTSALEMQGLENDSLNKIIASYEKEFLSGSYQDTLWVA
jgi:transcriptional regulator with XRE-family HTH domain